MNRKEGEAMSLVERAWQVWPLLAYAARNRQLLTYGVISRLTGMPAAGVGGVLEPIQSYCLLNGLPALTSLVVNESTGLPGIGFIAAGDVPREFIRVFKKDWSTVPCPGPAALAHAVQARPSNGIPLDGAERDAPESEARRNRTKRKAPYQRLRTYLDERRGDERVRMTFSQVEDVIGTRLPRSAFEHRAWWSNPSDTSGRAQAAAWREAGFRVQTLHQDRNEGWVEFVRSDPL